MLVYLHSTMYICITNLISTMKQEDKLKAALSVAVIGIIGASVSTTLILVKQGHTSVLICFVCSTAIIIFCKHIEENLPKI